MKDWVNSPNAINEVGCIHTIQGYDLNYAGVIIGPEISYDPVQNKIVVDPKKYRDKNGRIGVEDMAELERYVINIYKTLLTRGIKGTYIYVADPALRELFSKSIVESSETNLRARIPVRRTRVPLSEGKEKKPRVGS